MTTPPNRQPQGIPVGGQFAPGIHAEPSAVLAGATNRYADIDSLHNLDSTVSKALSPKNLSWDGARPAAEQTTEAEQIRKDWAERRSQLLTANRRQAADDYALRAEDEANALLKKAAHANLRSIADGLLEKHPNAATMTLSRDYDDGNLAVYVESVQDKDGNELGDPESFEPDARGTAQELVSEYSSRQLSRFVDDGPVNLAQAAMWSPDGSLASGG
jgi:hypothetical protein